jgi:hypothetical protein
VHGSYKREGNSLKFLSNSTKCRKCATYLLPRFRIEPKNFCFVIRHFFECLFHPFFDTKEIYVPEILAASATNLSVS